MAWKVSGVKKKGYGSRKRKAIGMLCDISSSMEPLMDIINHTVKELIKRVKNNPECKGTVDFLLIFFNGDVIVKVEFQVLEEVEENAVLIDRCYGYTDTGKALLKARELLMKKKREYKENGLGYYQPKLFLLTDGYPVAWKGASENDFREVSQRYQVAVDTLKQDQREKKLQILAAGIQRKNGPSANMEKLKELTDCVICIAGDEDIKKEIEDSRSLEDFFEMLEATFIEDSPLEQIAGRQNRKFKDTPISDVVSQDW